MHMALKRASAPLDDVLSSLLFFVYFVISVVIAAVVSPLPR